MTLVSMRMASGRRARGRDGLVAHPLDLHLTRAEGPLDHPPGAAVAVEVVGVDDQEPAVCPDQGTRP